MTTPFATEDEVEEEDPNAPWGVSWYDDNHEAIQELYAVFIVVGRQLFGEAFHQYSSQLRFARYVHQSTVSVTRPF